MKRKTIKEKFSYLYILIFIVCAFLFFTNDFGLVDLRKTSVVIGVGIDYEEEEVVLTAQLAIPQPAENGENTKFNVVTGKGASVASALNEINVKTGFYPKMMFCKLIVLGESCFDYNLKQLLDYFYVNEYTGLDLLVAATEGKAAELISQQFPCGNSAVDVITKLLSSEAQASGNVASVTLKDVGEKLYSKSAGVYMPFLKDGILEETGSGGAEGGSGGGSGGSSGSSGGGGGGGSEKQCEESELICNSCAVFSDGDFAGLLGEADTFALALIVNDVKHAFVESGEGQDRCVLGLRSCKGGIDLKMANGSPVLEFSFKSTVKLQDSEKGFSVDDSATKVVPQKLLKTGEKTIGGMFQSLFENSVEYGCDFLGVKDMLYKSYSGLYDQYSDNLFSKLTVTTKVELKSFS